MENLNNEFVRYEIALKMKKLGFNEPCMAFWGSPDHFSMDSSRTNNPARKTECTSPTYQAAFKWFREEHNIDAFFWRNTLTQRYRIIDILINCVEIDLKEFDDKEFDSYEEAEIACLEKLCEIVKNNK